MKRFQDTRYVSLSEAMWHIFGFHLSNIHPYVMVLQIYLPNAQQVTFREDDDLTEVIERERTKRSMLTTFFECNRVDHNARSLLYKDFPRRYVWNKGSRHWSPKKTVHERAFGVSKKAALERGLIENDNCLSQSLTEAALFQLPVTLRRLFTTILIYCEPRDVRKLWDDHYYSMAEDYVHQYDSFVQVCNMVLNDINISLQSMGVFYIDGPGGTGKDYFYNALLAEIQSCGLIAIATTTSGAATNNTSGGRTTHLRFKIPLNVDKNSICNIKKQTRIAQLLLQAKLIIWDEVSMVKRNVVEPLDCSVQDIMGVRSLFGGKIMGEEKVYYSFDEAVDYRNNYYPLEFLNSLTLPVCYDDDDDEERSNSLKDNIISGLPSCAAITPSSLTEEPDNSLSMGDEYLDTVLAMESDQFIKSSVENLVPILSESEGVPDNMCDAPFHGNSSPLDVSKDQFKDFFDSNDESTLIDDDSFSIDNIEYVEASPPNSELISSKVMEIVIPKSSSTSLNSFLEETNTFDNSLPEFEIFCFDLEEISSGSTTTRSDISLPEYEDFYDDHVKEISSGSATTHSDFYLYDLFIFEYDCFCFKIEPNLGDFTMDVVKDTFPTREPRVHNALPTHPTLQLNMDFIFSSESLFAYVIWIFLPFLLYLVAPQYLLSFENEDTIFDLGISSYHISSFTPDVSHWSGTFIKFKVLNESPMEISFSICSPMDQ
nr:ATP-dependent DNA helicase PIF1 [Tanacetum cinerariifolium]